MTLITSHPLALMKPGLSTCFYELFFFFGGGGGVGKGLAVYVPVLLFSATCQIGWRGDPAKEEEGEAWGLRWKLN